MSARKTGGQTIISKPVAEFVAWSALILLFPLTIALIYTSNDKALYLVTWIVLSLIVVIYAYSLRNTVRRAEKELAEARERRSTDHGQLVTILNSMSVGIISTNREGNIKLYNAALLSLLDTNENIAGTNVSDVVKILSSENHKPVDIMSLVTKNYLIKHDDLILQYTEDDEIRLSITINPIRGPRNRLDGYIFIIEDITKTKSLEEERDEFISVMNHELRTPIAITEASVSNAQLLLDRDASKAILKKTFEDAHDQIVFLANMVNDLGTLSRAERGIGDEPDEIDVDLLASELNAKYSPHAKEHKLRFDLDVIGRIGTVSSSKLYLEEILQNLITNSIKYTHEGGVTLHIRKTPAGILFAVKDTGIGISKTDLKRIFEKFYRSEDYRTRETSGTGLGLYVVQKLAKKIGVKIEIASRLNHGSTFSFTLPVK